MNADNNCFVTFCDYRYVPQMRETHDSLRRRGYTGDVCVLVDDSLKDHTSAIESMLACPSTSVKHIPNIDFGPGFAREFMRLERRARWREKAVQYQKFNLFDTYFKRWEYILYCDAGVKIYDNVKPVFDCRKSGKLLAHSDAYESYEWKLSTQFDQTHPAFSSLQAKYDLNCDYPQSTLMLYDTSIIDSNTKSELIELTKEYPISITNDQGVVALYFVCVKKIWEQIKLGDDRAWYYDFQLRDFKKDKPHIILKYGP